MRKVKQCQVTRVDRTPLRVRTCERPKLHDGPHHDKFGSWQSTQDGQTEYGQSVNRKGQS